MAKVESIQQSPKQDAEHPAPMTIIQMRNSLEKVPDWEFFEGGKALKRTFIGNNFTGALILANKIGLLCDQEGHYPEITVGTNFCKVMFPSHPISGLQENDFILAFKIDQLLGKLREAHHRYSLEQFNPVP